ncbi:transmembrane protein 235-like [Gadus chalcogrammus]|uniref:transmembrane protein 235-like n=1 Tax=Gadus chalcogrammus TaxID=1042646 RepID=UPI0024C49456|nr:transmembrane protein 235-like [Gadus chalcogrammus]
MRYRGAVLAAGFAGLLSFTVLAVAIGTDYWYIIDVHIPNYSGTDDLSSHSGLWTTHEGQNSSSLMPSFNDDTSSLSEVEKHLSRLHKVVVVLLPLSLVLLVGGWILGLVSALARSSRLLAAAAAYFLLCSLFTLAGLCVYVSYSQCAMEEFQRLVSPEDLANVGVSYGWSCALAWLSLGLELSCGLLLLLAARLVRRKQRESGVAIAMT